MARYFRRQSPNFDWTTHAYPSLNPLDVTKKRLSKEIDHLQDKLIIHRRNIRQLHVELKNQIKHFDIKAGEEINQEKARDKRSILVYNVSNNTELGELMTHFEICGEIEDIEMLYDKDIFLNRACVIFKHEVYAYIALCLNKTDLVGQKIRVLPWNLNFPLKVIQLIVKKWGAVLENRFTLTSKVRYRIRVATAIRKHIHELMSLFLKASTYSKDASFDQLQELILDTMKSLELVGKYPLSYLECDERLIF